ncbi:Rpp20 subunit of nuclear RNase MRP and P-domain-containing protein [Cryomyces antarcticus]
MEPTAHMETLPAASEVDQNPKGKPKKLTRLPDCARIEKRPLLHPVISSPYSSAQNQKAVYISSKTPFISAVKRVRALLKQIEKRSTQSHTATKQRKAHGNGVTDIAAMAAVDEKDPEEVVLKATGKAIEKALNLGLFFQGQEDCKVRIRTGSVAAIDDIVPIGTHEQTGMDGVDDQARNEDSKNINEALPETRIRHTSVVEVAIILR